MIIQTGYLGSATLYDTSIRCTDFSVNVIQTPLFYDHYIGLRDSIPTALFEVKSDIGNRNPQKIIWRGSTKIVQGGLSFPWVDSGLGLFWTEARTGSSFDMDFNYTCGIGRSYTGCKVNSYSLKASAGEIINTSLDIIGTHAEEKNDEEAPLIDRNDKLVSWDAVSITVTNEESKSDELTSNLAYVEFNVANNCIPIFTMGGNKKSAGGEAVNYLEPFDIRVGIQVVTGTLAYYHTKSLAWLENANIASVISFKIGEWEQNLNVVFNPQQQNSAMGPIIRTVQFTGVDDALPDA